MTATNPTEALARLRGAAGDGRLDEIAERHDVRLLGAFGSAARGAGAGAGATPPHDLDVAVAFRSGSPLDVLGLAASLAELTGCEVLDVVVLDGADPVLRAEALSGVPLYESEPGGWATEQMAALAERWDTAWLRRLDLEALAGRVPR